MNLDLSTAHEQIVRELQRAPHDRHHPWRTPVLASVAADGAPRARTVVLRSVAEGGVLLRIYTDARSSKVPQMQHHSVVSLVFWNPRTSLQLRVQAQAQVHAQGPLVDEAWARMQQAPSASDYLSAQAPGSLLVSGEPELSDSAQASSVSGSTEGPGLRSVHHLAIIECRATTWDALWLARTGHRRAAWHWSRQGQTNEGQWLVP